MNKENLSKVHIQTLDFLAAALFGYPVPDTDDIEGVYELLRIHAVETLVSDVLKDVSGLSPELRREWTTNILTRINLNERNLQAQTKLIDLLSDNGYRVAVIKGMSASQYYPQPLLRVLGDIDILFDSKDEEGIVDLLLKNGYHYSEERQNRHHLSFFKQGQEFELHRRLGSPVFNNFEREYDDEMSLANTKTVMCTLDGYSAEVYPDSKNGLIFLSHFAQHLMIDNEVGLRQLIDWAVFADSVSDSALWQDELLPLYEKFGLRKLAITLTRICQIYFHFDEEKYKFALQADEDICEKLMMNILRNGNFATGVDKNSRATVSMITDNKSIFSWFKMLQKRGLKKWKAARRYPFLRPFAWLYQLTIYIKKTLLRKSMGTAVAKDYKSARDYRSIIDTLGLN